MNEDSDEDSHELGYKRVRAKIKAQNKNKKLVKLDVKRKYVQQDES